MVVVEEEGEGGLRGWRGHDAVPTHGGHRWWWCDCEQEKGEVAWALSMMSKDKREAIMEQEALKAKMQVCPRRGLPLCTARFS